MPNSNKPKLVVDTRNLSRLRFRIWRFDLGSVLESRRFISDKNANLANLSLIVRRHLKDAGRIGRPDMEFEKATADAGDGGVAPSEAPTES